MDIRRTNDRKQPGSSFGNLGIGSTMVEVPETGVYKSQDGRVSKHYRAGTRIPIQEAKLLGIVPLEPAPPEPDVTPLSDADLGERYAQCLAAAGYELVKREDPPVTDDDKARAAAQAKRAEAEAKAAKKPENKQEPAPANKADAPEPKS